MGRFDLAFHRWFDPIEGAVAAAYRQEAALLTALMGETVVLDEHGNAYWWREIAGPE